MLGLERSGSAIRRRTRTPTRRGRPMLGYSLRAADQAFGPCRVCGCVDRRGGDMGRGPVINRAGLLNRAQNKAVVRVANFDHEFAGPTLRGNDEIAIGLCHIALGSQGTRRRLRREERN
jgi:hypothetical protein